MKTLKFLIMGVLLFGSFACSNENEPVVLPEKQIKADNTALAEALKNVVENPIPGSSSYIIFDSKTGECLIMSEEEYCLAKAFAILVCGVEKDDGGESIKDAPAGEGWKEGGRGNSDLDALLIANKISKLIPKGRNFEIRVEYQKDKSFIVYYRLIS